MDDQLQRMIMRDTAQLEGVGSDYQMRKFEKKYLEPLDVVDDSGEVVGTAPRGLIHRSGLRHRTVHVLLHDNHREFLLQTRGLGADKKPGRLDSTAAGHVKAGETDLASSALRELEEEVGFTCNASELELVSEFNRTTPFDFTKPHIRNRERRVLFTCLVGQDARAQMARLFETRTSPSEVRRLSWVSLEDVLALIHAGRAADGLRGCFFEYLGQRCSQIIKE